MPSAVQLAGEFKVMKDTEDRLNDSHNAGGRLTSVHRNKGVGLSGRLASMLIVTETLFD
jgi:hypothetical protein